MNEEQMESAITGNFHHLYPLLSSILALTPSQILPDALSHTASLLLFYSPFLISISFYIHKCE